MRAVLATLVACLALAILPWAAGDLDAVDRAVALDFFYSTGGPDWVELAGNPPLDTNSTSECSDWKFIGCDATLTHVERINPVNEYTNLTGTIPASLANLTQLQLLNIRNEPNLVGDFPDVLASPLLEAVRVENCGLDGTVGPFTDCVLNGTLRLSGNALRDIHPSIGNCDGISWIELSFNNLSLSVMPNLTGLASLETFDVSDNNITAPFPDYRAHSTLKVFSAANNNFYGTIPAVLPPALRVLDLSRNNVSGTVPVAVFGLFDIFLDGNNLTGSLPSFVPENTLTRIVLSDNKLTGYLPDSFGDLSDACDVDLRNNRFSGRLNPNFNFNTTERLSGNPFWCPLPSPTPDYTEAPVCTFVNFVEVATAFPSVTTGTYCLPSGVDAPAHTLRLVSDSGIYDDSFVISVNGEYQVVPSDSGEYWIEVSVPSGQTWTPGGHLWMVSTQTNLTVSIAAPYPVAEPLDVCGECGGANTTCAVDQVISTPVNKTAVSVAWVLPPVDLSTRLNWILFDLVRATDANMTANLVTVQFNATSPVLDTGLVPGQAYYYRVVVRTNLGTLPAVGSAAVAAAVPVGLPAAPASIAMTTSQDIAGSGLVVLNVSWALPSDTGGLVIDGVCLESSTSADFSGTIESTWINDTAVTWVAVTPAPGLTTYVRVAVVNSAGLSSWSSTVSLLVDVPSTVTALATTAINATSLSLSWGPPASDGGALVLGYVAEAFVISGGGGGGGGGLGDVIANGTGAATVIHGLFPATSYQFRVRARNVYGYSASAFASYTTGISFGTGVPAAGDLVGLTSCLPSATDIAGGSVHTVLGTGFEAHDNVAVLVGEVFAINVTIVDDEELEFRAPAQEEDGYYRLTIMVGAQLVELDDALYYSSDCANQVGRYGRGSSCSDCPDGAFCPGGFRLWPLPGHWNSGEFSNFVGPCQTESRCLGGRFSVCAEGYTGAYCGDCLPGYYLQGLFCVRCPEEPIETASPWTVNAIFFLVFVVAVVLCSDTTLTTVVATLTSLQLIGSQSNMDTENLPQFVRVLYAYLAVLNLDYQTLNPGCTAGKNSFQGVFFGNLYLPVAVFLIMMTLLWILSMFDPGRKTFYLHRRFRGTIILMHTVYLNVATRCMQAIFCRRTNDGVLRLVAEPSLICFEGSHAIMSAISALILVLFTVIYPVTSVMLVSSSKNKLLSPASVARYGYIYEQYKITDFYYGFVGIAVSLMVSGASAFFFSEPQIQFPIILTAFVGNILILIVRRPYYVKWKNWTNGAVVGVSLLSSTLNLLSALRIFESGALESVSIIVVVVIGVAVALVLSLTSWVIVRYCVERRRGEGASGRMNDYFQVEADFLERPFDDRNLVTSMVSLKALQDSSLSSQSDSSSVTGFQRHHQPVGTIAGAGAPLLSHKAPNSLVQIASMRAQESTRSGASLFSGRMATLNIDDESDFSLGSLDDLDINDAFADGAAGLAQSSPASLQTGQSSSTRSGTTRSRTTIRQAAGVASGPTGRVSATRRTNRVASLSGTNRTSSSGGTGRSSRTGVSLRTGSTTAARAVTLARANSAGVSPASVRSVASIRAHQQGGRSQSITQMRTNGSSSSSSSLSLSSLEPGDALEDIAAAALATKGSVPAFSQSTGPRFGGDPALRKTPTLRNASFRISRSNQDPQDEASRRPSGKTGGRKRRARAARMRARRKIAPQNSQTALVSAGLSTGNPPPVVQGWVDDGEELN